MHAESLGSKYKNISTGNFGLVSAISFNGNKIITTGGGGSILTNYDKIADKAKVFNYNRKKTASL